MVGIAFIFLASTLTATTPPKDYRLSAPKYEVTKGLWPKDSQGNPVYGFARLACSLKPDRSVENCSVQEESPAGSGIGAHLLQQVDKYRVRIDADSPAPADGWVSFKISYLNDTNPDWLRKPTIDQLMAVFPSKAGGRAGSAQITCIVKADGLLRACKVTRETPEGLGFGAAALSLAPTFLMKPAMKEGRPVESEVTIPISFGATYGSGGPSIRVVTTAAWDKTPTILEILAELDKKVGDKFADGKVVFQCTVSKKTGRLADCITINTSPGMAGFTGAARALTSKFEANKDLLAGIKEEVRVNLAFSFPDMQSEAWSKRYVTHPMWLRTVSPDPNQPLFPEEAAKAGLKTGSATVDCVLSASGALADCTTVSESTSGVGFGEMAKKIAGVFVANLWTEDGLPADGAHVMLPIKMNYDPKAAAGGEAPTPATTPEASPGSPPPSR